MSQRRILLQTAFLLHRRPYRNTSLLLEVFSRDHGRFSLVGKGARRPSQKIKAYLQPFQPLLLSWLQGQDLGQLIQTEPIGPPCQLKKAALYSAFYLNELLLRLLPVKDPHPVLFDLYRKTLFELETAVGVEPVLRLFEKHLLMELGYGLLLDRDSRGEPVAEDRDYVYLVEQGPVPLDASQPVAPCIGGKALLQLHTEQLHEEACLGEIKSLMRYVMQYYLGSSPLKSRLLYKTIIEH